MYMGMLPDHVVQEHSLLAFRRWKELWTKNCELNKPKIVTSHAQIFDRFKHRAAILFSYGPSFLENVAYFKAQNFNREDYVIGCVDKAYLPLYEQNIVADFVLLADGSVDPKQWLHGVPGDAIRQTMLISNVYGHPGWSDYWIKHSEKTNIFWYLNKDNIRCGANPHIGTAQYFGPKVGYYEMIEAGSNVGNSLVIFTRKIFGCRTIYLFAFDYSWGDHEYYGTCAPPKRYLMPIERVVDINNDIVFSSQNMQFSAAWLDNYIAFCRIRLGIHIINLTGRGILRETKKAA